jgi:hypothetical protein
MLNVLKLAFIIQPNFDLAGLKARCFRALLPAKRNYKAILPDKTLGSGFYRVILPNKKS